MTPDRTRWPGFHIGKSDRDQAIAAWLDQADADGINVSELVKNHLYEVATGQSADPMMLALEDIVQRLISLERDVRRLATGVRPAHTVSAPVDDAEDIERRLGALPD
jgi:hypothetical protein